MTQDVTTIPACDDEQDVREMLQEYLQRRGYAVLAAENSAVLHQVIAEKRRSYHSGH